ncbi:MAG: OstA family protein [Alphaproteobacteria bacterium]|nr:OstA family protein [Alphaproteobacteria bacterium]
MAQRIALKGLALGCALAAASLFSAPAFAQLSTNGGPISYAADSLEYFDSERRLVLTGNVEIVQNDANLRADRVTLYFASGGGGQAQGGMSSGDINRMVAAGDVYFVRPEQQARGDNAVYETGAGTVTFTGNVVVASAENVIRGETLVLQMNAGLTTLSPGGGRRVQGVFRPRDQ